MEEALGMNLRGEMASPLAAISRSRSSSFALGLSASAAAGTVKSLPGMAKAATQPGARGKLTQEQLEARAQQRIEDDELIREAQKGNRAAFDTLVRRYDQNVLRLAMHLLATSRTPRTCIRRPSSRPIAT